MAAIELLAVRLESSGGMERLVGAVQLADGGQREIYFGVAPEHASLLHVAADPFVPALLVPAMAAGVDLRLRLPVSERLLGQLELAQDILARFHGFRRAEVIAQTRAGGEPAPATATQFSGGVDSSFTLLRSLQGAVRGTRPADYLLFFTGLEHPLSTMGDVRAAIETTARVAERTGTRLVVVETNLRDVFDPDYEWRYVGAAVSAVSLALACGIGTVLVPSSQDYGWMMPAGSHPMLDPLWSTERQRIVVSGAETRRVDKLAALVREWPESLQWLRVCIGHAGGSTNCGHCRKCARTMATLAALGVLEKTPMFPHALSPQAWRELSGDHQPLLTELRDFAREVAPGQPITAAIDRTLARARRRLALRTLAENTPVLRRLFIDGRRMKRGVRHLLRGGPAYDSPLLFQRVRGLLAGGSRRASG